MSFFKDLKKKNMIREMIGDHVSVEFDPTLSYRDGNIGSLTFNVKFADGKNYLPMMLQTTGGTWTDEDVAACFNYDGPFITCLSLLLTFSYMIKVLGHSPEEAMKQMETLDFKEFAQREKLLNLFIDMYLLDIVMGLEQFKEQFYFYDLGDKDCFEDAVEFVNDTLKIYDEITEGDAKISRSEFLKKKLQAEVADEENDIQFRNQLNFILHEPNFDRKYEEKIFE